MCSTETELLEYFKSDIETLNEKQGGEKLKPFEQQVYWRINFFKLLMEKIGVRMLC